MAKFAGDFTGNMKTFYEDFVEELCDNIYLKGQEAPTPVTTRKAASTSEKSHVSCVQVAIGSKELVNSKGKKYKKYSQVHCRMCKKLTSMQCNACSKAEGFIVGVCRGDCWKNHTLNTRLRRVHASTVGLSSLLLFFRLVGQCSAWPWWFPF